MQFSYSLSSSKPPKPSLKPLEDQSSSVKKAFATESDPSKTLTLTDIIAPIANESRPLNLRAKKDSKPKFDRFQSDSSIERLMLDRLRSDLDRLPEDKGMDEFEDMPVENFATALLKGYGWHEGRGVGKNAKEDIKLYEINKRNGKEGLGFVNDMFNNSNLAARPVTKDKKTSGGFLKSWLNRRIRVRIISEELEGGRLYLKKGEIVDVVGPTSCDVCMDDSREVIRGVDEEFIQTALPRRGGPVLVLSGRRKGVYGSLVEKDMDRETAVVCDANTHALVNVRLEQVAEYVGDIDDIGYY